MKRDFFAGSAFPSASIFVAAALVGGALQAPLAWSQPQSEEERRKGWGIPDRVDSAPVGMGAPGTIPGLAVPGAVGGGKVNSEIGITTPGVVVAAPQNGLQGIKGALSIVLTEIGQGTLTPQQAWTEKRLSPQDILQFLASGQRLTQDENNEKLQSELAGVLVAQAPETIKDPQKLAVLVRVALGRYYSSVGDVRVAEIAEELLRELDKKPKQADPWPELWGIIFLAQHHERTAKWQKAGETWERALTYQSNVNWWQAGVRIDAARAYKKTGTPENQQKAETLYSQVPKFGNGWDTIMSYYDHALPLIDAGKLEEAKAILSQDLQVKENPEVGLIAQNAWLASLAYRQGNLDEAMRYGQKVMQLGEKTNLPHESSRNLYALGRDVYLRAGGWKTQPIQSDVKEVIIKTNPLQPDKPLYARFRIKTYGDISVTATVDNPTIQVRVLPVDNWERDAVDAKQEESEVIIEIPIDFKKTQQRNILKLRRSSFEHSVTQVQILVTGTP